MPSEIERNHVEQGYCLPEGLTRRDVDRMRRKWNVNPSLVQLAIAPGGVGWGVPIFDSKPSDIAKSLARG